MSKPHDQQIRSEFTRQAEAIAKSPHFGSADILERIAELVGAGSGDSVLDVACGTGIVAKRLAADAHDVVGVDLTPAMLERARTHCAGTDGVRFESGDALALPFPDASFDRVVTRLSFHHFEEPSAVLTEMRRVVRVGGRLVVIDVTASEDPDEARVHNALEVLRDPSHVEMLSPSRMEALFFAAGLTVRERAAWEQARGFDEWAAIANDTHRTRPLRDVMTALATAGVGAGIALHTVDGEPRFVHRWLALAAHP